MAEEADHLSRTYISSIEKQSDGAIHKDAGVAWYLAALPSASSVPSHADRSLITIRHLTVLIRTYGTVNSKL